MKDVKDTTTEVTEEELQEFERLAEQFEAETDAAIEDIRKAITDPEFQGPRTELRMNLAEIDYLKARIELQQERYDQYSALVEKLERQEEEERDAIAPASQAVARKGINNLTAEELDVACRLFDRRATIEEERQKRFTFRVKYLEYLGELRERYEKKKWELASRWWKKGMTT